MGFHDGRPVFVPYAIPGEVVTAEITGERGKALFARGLTLNAASADRAAPRCPHFGPGRCWACQWQHIDYPAQVLLKQDLLADQLSRIGKLPDRLLASALRPVLPAREQWAYQHSLRLRRDKSGAWGLPRESREIHAIAECHIAHPDLLDLLRQLEFDYPQARSLTIRRGSDGAMTLIFEVDAEIAPELQSDLPLSVNLILPNREPVNLIGDAHARFRIAQRDFRVTAGAYIRDNLSGIAGLAAAVKRALASAATGRVLDLYAGVGIFSAFLAPSASLVTLVESYPPAANDAEANLRQQDNVDIIEGAVDAVLADLAARGARCEAAVLDPPSAGLSADAIQALAALETRRIALVHGDPAALARDSRALIAAGYRLRDIQPVDIAPQTWYISAVASFEP